VLSVWEGKEELWHRRLRVGSASTSIIEWTSKGGHSFASCVLSLFICVSLCPRIPLLLCCIFFGLHSCCAVGSTLVVL
jgi:hypothetical protein